MARQRALPALPDTIPSVLGPIPVTLVPDLLETEDATGHTDFETRTVRINTGGGAQSPKVDWQTYWHEAAHIALWDGGAHQQLTHKQREAVCDALGTYLSAAMQAGFLVVRQPRKRKETAHGHEGVQR